MAKTKRAPITIDDLKSIDLGDLRREIDQDEATLAEYVSEQRRKIDGKRQLAKTVDLLINGKPPKKPRQVKAKATRSAAAAPATDEPHRPSSADQIDSYLKLAGSASVNGIAAGTGLSKPTVYNHIADTKRFVKNPDGTYSRKQ